MEKKRLVIPGQRDRIFYAFLTSYLVLLLLITGIGTASYLAALGVVERDIRETNLALLNQSRQILERRFSEVEGILNQLASHPQVTRMTYTENPLNGSGSVVEIQELQELLLHYKWHNSFLDSLHLFLKKNGIIISSEDIFLRKKLFYDHFFRYGTLESRQWEELLYGSLHFDTYLPVADSEMGGGRARTMGILHSVSVQGYGLTRSGVLAAFIREDAVSGLLETTLLREGGASFILDEENRLIASAGSLDLPLSDLVEAAADGGSELGVNGEAVLVSSVVSPERGWTYINIVPRRLAFKRLVVLRRFILSIIFGSLLAGSAFSVYLANRTSAPLRAIRGLLADRKDLIREGRPLEQFPEAVRELLTRNRGFREKIARQNDYIKVSFIENLLQGKYKSDRETALSFSLFDETLPEFPLGVLCVKFQHSAPRESVESVEGLHAFRLVVRTLAEDLLGSGGICHDTGPDSMVLLRYSPEPKFREAMEEFACELLSLVSGSGEGDILLSSGCRAESFSEVSHAFREGLSAEDYLFPDIQGAVRWFQDIPAAGSIRYSLEREKHLMNLVLSGDRAGTEELLLELKEDNFLLARPSCDGVRQFRHDIRSTILKIRNRMVLVEEEEADYKAGLERLFSARKLEPFFLQLQETLGRLSDFRNCGKRSHNEVLKEKLLSYIDENFQDSCLYLGSLAGEFNLSEVYLSQFFKEHSGEKFSTYLERIRIAYACRLIEAEEASLGEIAERCGYNSAQVFRRAFKRIEGLTPSQYKENLLGSAPLP